MIPKAPFACDLTAEEELVLFEGLKPRLADVWSTLTGSDDLPCTSVVVPSMTLDQDELHKLVGAPFYEERLLFLLIRLRNPRAHVVYVTSQPVHPLILEYYLNLLTGVPPSHARAHLTMLCAYDGSPRSLTEKILERPRLIQRIRAAIHDPMRAYLTVFNSTPLERKLAVLLGIPLNGLDPHLRYLGTKSGSRKVIRQAGVESPAGFEDLATEHDVADALLEIRRLRPKVTRAVIKLNESFSGEGNAVFRFPQAQTREAILQALTRIEFSVPSETHDGFFEKFRAMQGVVEEFLAAPETASPSAQLRTGPRGGGAPAVDARPNPRRTNRAGLPGLPLSGPRWLSACDPGRRSANRPRAGRRGRRQPVRCRLRGAARRSVGLLADLRLGDQSPDGGNHTSAPGAQVPDRW